MRTAGALVLGAVAGAAVAAALALTFDPDADDAEPVTPAAPLPDDVAARGVFPIERDGAPANRGPNARMPSDEELAAYRAARHADDELALCRRRLDDGVTGAFSGTTDEILQWAALKWGFEPDLFRAVAFAESSWDMGFVGDEGESFGIMQVKRTVHLGTFPLARESTAFNADFYGAFLRHLVEGCATWLNDVERGREYAAGDVWGSVGTWFAGRWYTPGAIDYIRRVQRIRRERPWEHAQP